MNARQGPSAAPDAVPDGREKEHPAQWELRLYIAGRTPRCARALINLRQICATHLAGRYSIEVVDLLENPRLAADDKILAVPTLVRKLPEPMRKIVGDLSDSERLLVGLQIRQVREQQ